MEYKPIKTQWQYDVVAKRMEQLTDADPYTPEADELKILTEMIVEYELKMAASDDNYPEPDSASQAWLKTHPGYHTPD